MSSSGNDSSDYGLLKTLGSLQFGLTLLIALALVSVIGTLLPQGRSPGFYETRYGTVINFFIEIFRFDDTYHSPLFIGLLGFLGLNLTLCSLVKFPAVLRRTFKPDLAPDAKVISRMPVSVSVTGDSLEDVRRAFDEAGFPLRVISGNRLYGEKGRFGYLGAFVVHLSLLLFLAGGVVSLVTGLRGHITLTEGEAADVLVVSEDASVPLGFEIELERFEVSFYDDFPDRPKSYTSSVIVRLPDGTSFQKDIRVNDPLMLNDFTVYQSSYGLVEESPEVSDRDCIARVSVRLKGAAEDAPPLATFDMEAGGTYPVPGAGDSLSIRLAEVYRDFRGASPHRGGMGPTVRIDVMAHGTLRWSVYAFENFPGMNMPMLGDIPLVFSLDGVTCPGGEGGSPAVERYYTVLGVVRDRGVPVMWAGAVFMVLGLALAFYVNPRRIWVFKGDGGIIVGGRSKRDADSFREFVKRTLGKT